MKQMVLLVDDDFLVHSFVGRVLSERGFVVVPAASAEEGLKLMRKDAPDLVILDLALNGVSGLDILGAIKNDRTLAQTPVIVLTGSDDQKQDVVCLDGGADDYVVKTFEPDILIARVKAVLRRTQLKGDRGGTLRCGNLAIDNDRRAVYLNDKVIENFTSKEFDLLYLLAKHSPKVLSRPFLIRKIWPERAVLDNNRTIDVHIRRIRLKLGDRDQTRLVTVTNSGYKLIGEDQV
jgi:two-component system alkaline phosphatase synthesis response regulator PhoP